MQILRDGAAHAGQKANSKDEPIVQRGTNAHTEIRRERAKNHDEPGTGDEFERR